MQYNKLIRDKIIDIIEAKGQKATFHVADSAEYWMKLKEKLQEEVLEFLEAESEEEMADIFEVIRAIVKEKGWDLDHIRDVQNSKREERGAFEKKIILENS